MNARKVMQALLDGKKVRQKDWTGQYYMFLEDNKLTDSTRNIVDWGIDLNDDWELYQEPKKKKRFWLWNVCEYGYWRRQTVFIDDYGLCTDKKKFSDWENIPKQKLENEFIEIDWER